jgi:predicted dehydrogenase
MTQNKKKTLGFIGCGNVAMNNHILVAKNIGFEIAWLLDFNEAEAQKNAKYFKTTAYNSQNFAKTPDTDLVLITAPYGARQPYYEELKNRKTAIMVEKPIAKTLLEHEAICSIRKDYEMASGFQYRNSATVRTAKQLIDNNMLGAIRHISCEFGTATNITAGGSFSKNIKLAGGGQLFETAIHNIDAIAYITNTKIVNTVSKKMEQEAGFDVHTEAKMTMTQADGNEFGFDLLVTAFRGTKNCIKIEFDNLNLIFSLFPFSTPVLQAKKGNVNLAVFDKILKDTPMQAVDNLYVFWTNFLQGLEDKQANYTAVSACKITTTIIEQLYK